MRDDDDDLEAVERMARSIKLFNRSHGKGYLKEESTMRYGIKTEQLGLRLSTIEMELIAKVREHDGISLTTWATFAMLRFVEYQDKEIVHWESERLRKMQAWTPPSPAPHAVNCRVATRVRKPFRLMTPGLKFATAVRWVMLDEAPRILATPSKAARLEAQAAFRLKMSKLPPVKLGKVQLLSGTSLQPDKEIE